VKFREKKFLVSLGNIVMTRTTRFDAADDLDSEERQVAHIAPALKSGDADFARDALGLVTTAALTPSRKECAV
jgi:hypothetical protein